ncbi:hypothetical protein EUGRSUZ_L02710 [Eucalyptus grandis]|uniref:Uncharacterized protein n=1 Tax=Eucalyptus grandis TaxID=71139 RepID=A0AAD9WIQ5_EUCGR|nr:hypothetical protein EUGRSUZ_L02710 [Eucalyptus grandis]
MKVKKEHIEFRKRNIEAKLVIEGKRRGCWCSVELPVMEQSPEEKEKEGKSGMELSHTHFDSNYSLY